LFEGVPYEPAEQYVWNSERCGIEDTGKHIDVITSLMRQISFCHNDYNEELSEVFVHLKHTTTYQISGDSEYNDPTNALLYNKTLI
jgi:hypothetical protein